MTTSRTIQALLLAGASLLAVGARAQTGVPTASGTAAASQDDIVVTARRTSQGSRAEQKNAINLVNIQPAEEIVKYPDFNAAESLSRIPGVSISADTGEGRFVVIRGIDSNLNGVTFGGVTLLNTQPGGVSFGGGGRAVELDTVPIGAIDQLQVRKTGLPDQEAEGLGGSVDLIPRTAQGIKKAFLDGTIGGGYEAGHGHAGIYRAELTGGFRFGPNKEFGLLLDGNYHEDARGFDDVEPGPLDASTITPTNVVLGTVDLRRYNYNRRRFGFGGELTFDPSPQSHYYFRADDAGYTERVNRQVLQYRNLGNSAIANPDKTFPVLTPDVTGTFTAPAPTIRLSVRDEQETALNFVGAFGGHNDLGKVILDYQASYTSATYHRDYDFNSTFSSNNNNFAVAYRPGGGIDGLPSLTPIGFNPGDPTQFTLTGFRNSQPEGAHDREWAGRLDVTVPFHLFADDERVKFGGKVRFRDKRDTQHLYNYFGFPGASPLPATPLTQILGSGPYNNFYSNNYAIGYTANYLAIRNLIPGNASRVPPQITENPLFNDTENIYAGFLEYTGKVGKLSYLAGFRVENTDATYRSNDIATGQPSVGKNNYTDFFPSVQLRYDATDKLVFRAIYSTEISRPGYNQIQNGTIVDAGAPAITVGNPGLKPITDNAFDVSAEYYLPHAGVLSIGLFDKEFNDYILNTLQRVTTDPRIPDNNGAIISINGYRNVSGAFARGIEAEYVQKFTSLPGLLSGLGFSGNVTYVHSHIKIRNDPGDGLGAEYAGLPGTSELTWNLAGFYEKDGIQVRISAQTVGASIFGVGGARSGDIYTDDKTQVDLTASYAVNSHGTLYFQAKNLTNGALRYYEGFQNRVTQREFYDVSYEAGLRFHF